MLVDQSIILTEGNGSWECFIVITTVRRTRQHEAFGIFATVGVPKQEKC